MLVEAANALIGVSSLIEVEVEVMSSFRSIDMLAVMLVHFWMIGMSAVMLRHQSGGVGIRSQHL